MQIQRMCAFTMPLRKQAIPMPFMAARMERTRDVLHVICKLEMESILVVSGDGAKTRI